MNQSSTRKTRVGLTSATVLMMALAAMAADAPAVKRTVLQRGDVSTPGREAVMAKAEIPGGGGTTGRHTHPGEEISYVLEGSLLLEVEGQAPKTIKAGDVFMIPAGRIHNATNKTSASATVLATYVVEKGKPLATPAK